MIVIYPVDYYLRCNIIIVMSSIHEGGISNDSQSFRSRRVSKNINRYQQSSLISEQNQFLTSYGNNTNFYTLNASKVTQKQRPNSPTNRNSLIKQLNQKNQILKKEVERVEKILNVGDHRRIVKMPEINQKVLIKQLENAYKQIKIYQAEVNRRETMYQHEGAYIEIIRKQQRILIERQDIVRKLQTELSETNRRSNEYVKLLTDDNIRKEYATRTSKLHKQIKYYQKILGDQEQKGLSDHRNIQAKNSKIAEMEKILLKQGTSKKMLMDMKSRCFDDKKVQDEKEKGGPMEDRSDAAFNNMKEQINLLKKMQKDYAKKLDQLQRQKTQAGVKSKESGDRLASTEQDLVNLQTRFKQMKKNIDPNKLKPLIKNNNSFWESSSITRTTQKGSNPLEHIFDIVEAGTMNKKSNLVNDRTVIGKKSAKIVALTLYQNRTQFLGFQASYLVGQSRKTGGYNVLTRENQRFMKDRSLKLEPGDFFNSFECSLNQDNIIVGFMAVSFRGKAIKGGMLDGTKKSIDVDGRQYPCCIYGCYSEQGWQLIGIEKIQAPQEIL